MEVKKSPPKIAQFSAPERLVFSPNDSRVRDFIILLTRIHHSVDPQKSYAGAGYRAEG
jgi:hypothetical protein